MRIALATAACLLIGCLEGPMGPAGPRGSRGDNGGDFQILTASGTVLAKNYTGGNPAFASLYLCACSQEPTVLSLGIENLNGVYVGLLSDAVIFSDNDKYGYDGRTGYFALIYDATKAHLQKNYKVKYAM